MRKWPNFLLVGHCSCVIITVIGVENGYPAQHSATCMSSFSQCSYGFNTAGQQWTNRPVSPITVDLECITNFSSSRSFCIWKSFPSFIFYYVSMFGYVVSQCKSPTDLHCRFLSCPLWLKVTFLNLWPSSDFFLFFLNSLTFQLPGKAKCEFYAGLSLLNTLQVTKWIVNWLIDQLHK